MEPTSQLCAQETTVLRKETWSEGENNLFTITFYCGSKIELVARAACSICGGMNQCPMIDKSIYLSYSMPIGV